MCVGLLITNVSFFFGFCPRCVFVFSAPPEMPGRYSIVLYRRWQVADYSCESLITTGWSSDISCDLSEVEGCFQVLCDDEPTSPSTHLI